MKNHKKWLKIFAIVFVVISFSYNLPRYYSIIKYTPEKIEAYKQITNIMTDNQKEIENFLEEINKLQESNETDQLIITLNEYIIHQEELRNKITPYFKDIRKAATSSEERDVTDAEMGLHLYIGNEKTFIQTQINCIKQENYGATSKIDPCELLPKQQELVMTLEKKLIDRFNTLLANQH